MIHDPSPAAIFFTLVQSAYLSEGAGIQSGIGRRDTGSQRGIYQSGQFPAKVFYDRPSRGARRGSEQATRGFPNRSDAAEESEIGSSSILRGHGTIDEEGRCCLRCSAAPAGEEIAFHLHVAPRRVTRRRM